MTRGRKKDLSIPPTRALVLQRDYRARKANYIADLEERVRKAESENDQLRKDLEVARAALGVPTTLFNPQVAEASRELMQHLTLATSTLNRFQQLAFPERPSAPVLPPLQLPPPDLPAQLRPASFPSPAPSPPNLRATLQSAFGDTTQPPQTQPLAPLIPSLTSPYPAGRKRLYREDSPEPTGPAFDNRNVTPRLDNSPTNSLGSDSDCCGGILDCRDLVERDTDKEEDGSLARLSVVRSTSERSYAHDNHEKYFP